MSIVILDGIVNATGDHCRAFTAHIGKFEIIVKAIINKQLSIAGMPIESIGIQCPVTTSLNAFEAIKTGFMETVLIFRAWRRYQLQIRYETSDATGTTLLGDD